MYGRLTVLSEVKSIDNIHQDFKSPFRSYVGVDMDFLYLREEFVEKGRKFNTAFHDLLTLSN